MANINLLPEDLRRHEEKEIKKASKQRRNIVDMNLPSNNHVNKWDESIERPSFWRRIFGTPNIPVVDKERARSFESVQSPAVSSQNQQSKPSHPAKEKWPKKFLGKPAPFIKDYSGQAPKFPGNAKGIDSIKQNGGMSWNYKYQQSREGEGKVSSTIEKNYYNPVSLPKNNISTPISVEDKEKINPSFFVEKVSRSDNRGVKKGDGWLDILKSLFIPRKKSFDFKSITDGNDLNHMKKMVDSELKQAESPKTVNNYQHQEKQSEKGPEQQRERPHANTSKNKSSKEYHLAPRNERAEFDINLIPEELVYQSQPNPLGKLVVILIVVIFAIGIVAGVHYYIAFEQQKLNKKIEAIAQENLSITKELVAYKKIEDENNQNLKKIVSIGGILENHIYWTKFFNTLEKYTLDGVYYSSFSADTSGAISLPAVAKDYSTAIRQIVALRQAVGFVDDVKVDAMNMSIDDKRGVSSISFEIKIVLNKNIFTQASNGEGNKKTK